jgi:hypothetical protein
VGRAGGRVTPPRPGSATGRHPRPAAVATLIPTGTGSHPRPATGATPAVAPGTDRHARPTSRPTDRAKRLPARPGALLLPLGTGVRGLAERRLESALDGLARAPRVAAITVTLGLEPDAPRVLFREADEDAAAFARTLAILRALGPLVGQLRCRLLGSSLDLLVFDRQACEGAPASSAQPRPPVDVEAVDWEGLLSLVGQRAAQFDELEALTCGVWRPLQPHDRDATTTLIRLAALGPAVVDEVRGQVRGGPRVRLYQRTARPRGTSWSDLLEALQRAALAALSVDEGAGLEMAFQAKDAASFSTTRAALRGRGNLSVWATLRGTGLSVPLPDAPGARDVALSELGHAAVERLDVGPRTLFQAEDGPACAAALAALVRAGPDKLHAVRAWTAEGETISWTNPTPRPATRRHEAPTAEAAGSGRRVLPRPPAPPPPPPPATPAVVQSLARAGEELGERGLRAIDKLADLTRASRVWRWASTPPAPGGRR